MNTTSINNPIHFIPDYSGVFGDKRLDKRASSLFSQLSLNPCSSISRLSRSRAEQKAYYRFLGNEKVKEASLINEARSRMSKLADGKHLLCIQDTSEINFHKHSNRLQTESGLGRSDNSNCASCFKIHPGFVLEAERLLPLGFSDIKIWHRPVDMADKFKRNYKNQPIQEKESYKWLEVAYNSKETLKNAKQVTFIEDREGDIYEQFASIPDASSHLLVRSKTTRKLADGNNLYSQVCSTPLKGTYEVELLTDHRKNRKHRIARIEVRFCKCKIKRPARLKKDKYPDSIEIYIVEAKEVGSNNSQNINWKLLTTHRVESFEMALQIIGWYNARWYVEQLFRLLKRKGFGIEDTELESGWAIRKMSILQLIAILKIMQMNIAYSDPEQGQPIEQVFEAIEIKALSLLNTKLQGKTFKQQNHNDPGRTKWAAWVIARLGGWKGYDSQGPPGVIVIKRGLERLSYIIEGIRLFEDVGTR